MLFNFGEISEDRFFERYWRRSPLHLGGGASRILGSRLDRARFLRVCDALEAGRPELVHRAGEGVVFAQIMDRADPELASIARAYEEAFSCHHVWFDGVYAEGGQGIRSHYDIADAFVLQQSGRKRWRLHPPTSIPEPEIRRRMLKESPLDVMYMPDEALELTLDAGDLLYIPLLWVHWGVSIGASTSVSLALNAEPALRFLWSVLRRGLSGSARWSAPMPARASEPRGLDALVGELHAELCSAPVRQRLHEAWLRCVYPSTPDMDDGAPAPSRESVLCRLYPALKDVLSEERAWWGPVPVVRVDRPLSSLSSVVQDEVNAHAASLWAPLEAATFPARLARAWLARRAAEDSHPPSAAPDKAHRALDRAPEASLDIPSSRRVAAMELPIDALREEQERIGTLLLATTALPSPQRLIPGAEGEREVERLRTRASLVLLDRLLRALEDAYASLAPSDVRDALAAGIAALLRMPVEERERAAHGPELRSFAFRAAEALYFGYASRLEAVLCRFDALLSSSTGTRISSPGEQRGFAGGPSISAPDGWYLDFFLRGPRAGGLILDPEPSDAALMRLASSIDDGIASLDDASPRARGRVLEAIVTVMPQQGEGAEGDVASAPPFSGLVVMVPRPAEVMATALAREAARCTARDLWAGYALLEADPEESYPSPFTGRPRSLAWLFEDTFAELQALALAHASGGAPAAAEALRILRDHGAPTPAGRDVLDALDAAVHHPVGQGASAWQNDRSR